MHKQVIEKKIFFSASVEVSPQGYQLQLNKDLRLTVQMQLK